MGYCLRKLLGRAGSILMDCQTLFLDVKLGKYLIWYGLVGQHALISYLDAECESWRVDITNIELGTYTRCTGLAEIYLKVIGFEIKSK